MTVDTQSKRADMSASTKEDSIDERGSFPAKSMFAGVRFFADRSTDPAIVVLLKTHGGSRQFAADSFVTHMITREAAVS